MIRKFMFSCACLLLVQGLYAQAKSFRVLAFYTGQNDLAHISFVKEANLWFAAQAISSSFVYESTTDWSRLNAVELKHTDIVLFLDTRPEDSLQRLAFRQYMESGGAWMGFHFSAFALTPSTYSQNWSWYHQQFLGSGQYVSNTWRPTSAILRVEDTTSAVTKSLPRTFRSSPNEWYRWEHDLRNNPDIRILLSIDSTSFPLGTGPKKHEIWTTGYYPVAWTNKKYRMVYFNMGHNDMDYESGSNRTLSNTFGNPEQDRLILQGLLWLGRKGR